jgi:hypothetical protein
MIPVFRRSSVGFAESLRYRRPELWKALPARAKKRMVVPAQEILEGYVNAFEPDFIVEMKPGLSKGLPTDRRVVVTADDLLPTEVLREPDLALGLTAQRVYRYLYKTQFRFVQKQPIDVFMFRAGHNPMSLFIATCGGSLPSSPSLSAIAS